jgi:hypothetical protein
MPESYNNLGSQTTPARSICNSAAPLLYLFTQMQDDVTGMKMTMLMLMLSPYSVLKMESVCDSETFIYTCESKRHNNPEEQHVYKNISNLKVPPVIIWK